MKKILFTIIGLSALFCMSSCDEAVYKGRKVYKAYFDYTLKDPESFKVYSEKYTKDGDFTVNWELDYGAKNSLGGMVREKATFTTVGTSIFIDANTPRNNNDAKIHRKSIIQSFWESFFHVNKKFICHFYSKELLLREIVNQ